tara:strand:+ start:11363 stop:12118 length:756 start_codon:yes stop_codon:yes gene_type:complete
MGFATIATLATTAYSIYKGEKTRTNAEDAADKAVKERERQQRSLDKEIQEYQSIKFTNPYAGMENPFEDLTVATDAARFQAEQGAQQRTNILEKLRSTAGSSGIGALAQSLANQGVLQARQISADLQKQEVANEQAKAKGAMLVDKQIRAGEAMLQEAESGRQATILGMQYGQAAGANRAEQQTLLNQANANLSADQMWMEGISGLSSADWDFSLNKKKKKKNNNGKDNNGNPLDDDGEIGDDTRSDEVYG